MPGMTLAVIPPLTAGYVVALPDLTALAYACTFAMTKPIARVHDNASAQAITTSYVALPWNTKDFDTDGMWASGSNTLLTIQTPGRYKVRYGMVVQTGTVTMNAFVQSVSGVNNPQGSGITSASFHGSYTVTSSVFGATHGSGLWPFYLYQGDTLSVLAQANATGASLNTTLQSFFSLEYVSVL